MQDFPDFESYLQDQGQSSHTRKRNVRSGIGPVPEFDRAATVTLEIEVLKETYDEILDAILANEWEREEGLRTVLLTGLGYLDAQLNANRSNKQAIANGEGDSIESMRMDPTTKELAAYHSMYSVMKFKAYKLYKANQTLEFNISGLRETERMWEGWADRMRREHSSLQAECIRLRSLMSEFKLDWDHAPVGELEVTGLVEEPAITTPLLPRALSDFFDEPLHEQPLDELLIEIPLEPSSAKPSLWDRFKNFLRGK